MTFKWNGTHGLWRIPDGKCPEVSEDRAALRWQLCALSAYRTLTCTATVSYDALHLHLPPNALLPQAWDGKDDDFKELVAPKADGSWTIKFEKPGTYW